MSSSKKNLPVKGLCGRCLFVCGTEPHSPPLHTVYVHTVYQFTQGRGEGGELNQREGERGNSSQSWVENTNMTDYISSP
jgi:hypothetical protein